MTSRFTQAIPSISFCGGVHRLSIRTHIRIDSCPATSGAIRASPLRSSIFEMLGSGRGQHGKSTHCEVSHTFLQAIHDTMEEVTRCRWSDAIDGWDNADEQSWSGNILVGFASSGAEADAVNQVPTGRALKRTR